MTSRQRIYALALVFLVFFVSLVAYRIIRQSLPPWPPLTPTLAITDTPTSTTEPPTLSTPPTKTPTLTPTPAPPVPLPCKPNYPSEKSGSDYVANSLISLEQRYTQIYGRERDSYDLFAVAYYNNLKALEDNSYHAIDPITLTIEKGWKIFIASPEWIDEYRKFPSPILGDTNPGNKDSTIHISGSLALHSLSLQIADCFTKAIKINRFPPILEPNSTRIGLLDYCQGDADIFGASERITEEMKIANGCEGVNFKEFEIATYAITIFVNENNPYADELIGLNRAELIRLLFSAETWNEVRPRLEPGNEPINRYFSSVEDGVFEIIKSELFPSWNSFIPNLLLTEDEYLIPGKVIGDIYSVGFSGYGYADDPNYRDSLRIIPVDNISPTSNTINADNPIYPLTRTLYLYTGEGDFNNNPLLRTFINYYLSFELGYLEELGYFFPNRKNWLEHLDTFRK